MFSRCLWSVVGREVGRWAVVVAWLGFFAVEVLYVPSMWFVSGLTGAVGRAFFVAFADRFWGDYFGRKDMWRPVIFVEDGCSYAFGFTGCSDLGFGEWVGPGLVFDSRWSLDGWDGVGWELFEFCGGGVVVALQVGNVDGEFRDRVGMFFADSAFLEDVGAGFRP